MYQSASRVPEAAHQSRPQCSEAADLSRRRPVLVDSPPRPLVAKQPDQQVSIAHSIVGGSAWEPTPWRAVQRAAWEVLTKEVKLIASS
jgi:hypothetical protein